MALIDPELLHMLIDCATDAGTDGNHGRHFVLHGEAPHELVRDLRYAGRTDYVTAWQSPRYRAILLAAEGAGRVVAFADRERFRDGVRLAGKGILPEAEEIRER